VAKKRIVITGGSSGIGESVASYYVSEGHEVYSLDVKQPKSSEIQYIYCDLAQTESINNALKDIPDSINTLLNIAGVPGILPPETILAVNTFGLINLTNKLSRRIEDGGCITSVASIAGFNWARNLVIIKELIESQDYEIAKSIFGTETITGDQAYSLSKECVVVYMMVMSGQLLSRNIRCNSVSPGPVSTPLLPKFKAQTSEGQIDWLISEVGRAADPKEIANMIVFLSSEAASYINGRDFIVDGGLSAGLAMGWIDKKASPLYKASRK